MVNQLATAQNLAADFSALGGYINVCTGPPGNSAVVLNEATGGSPANTRQLTTWTEGTNGSAVGSVVSLNLAPGTYPYMIMCQSSSGNTMVDWCILPTPIMVTTQAVVQLTPSVSVV